VYDIVLLDHKNITSHLHIRSIKLTVNLQQTYIKMYLLVAVRAVASEFALLLTTAHITSSVCVTDEY
jgi:hypothetical protein